MSGRPSSGEPTAWRVLQSHLVVDDEWLRLRADSCVDGRGSVISPYYVTVSVDWVCVVPFTPRGDLLVVDEYRHGAGRSLLGFPGGRITRSDESPAAAAERELIEETGCQGTDAQVVGSVWANAASQTNRVHVVVVTDVQPVTTASLDPGEQPYPRTMAYDDFKRLAQHQTLQSFHVAAFPFVDAWLAARRVDNP